jgi:hypothetical protein
MNEQPSTATYTPIRKKSPPPQTTPPSAAIPRPKRRPPFSRSPLLPHAAAHRHQPQSASRHHQQFAAAARRRLFHRSPPQAASRRLFSPQSAACRCACSNAGWRCSCSNNADAIKGFHCQPPAIGQVAVRPSVDIDRYLSLLWSSPSSRTHCPLRFHHWIVFQHPLQ